MCDLAKQYWIVACSVSAKMLAWPSYVGNSSTDSDHSADVCQLFNGSWPSIASVSDSDGYDPSLMTPQDMSVFSNYTLAVDVWQQFYTCFDCAFSNRWLTIDLCTQFYRFWHLALWAHRLCGALRFFGCRSVYTVLQILSFSIVSSSSFTSWLHFTS